MLEIPRRWLQYRPLKDPRTGKRVDAWHWDLRSGFLVRALRLAAPRVPYPSQSTVIEPDRGSRI